MTILITWREEYGLSMLGVCVGTRWSYFGEFLSRPTARNNGLHRQTFLYGSWMFYIVKGSPRRLCRASGGRCHDYFHRYMYRSLTQVSTYLST